MTYDCASAPLPDIVERLRNTKSRSKRELLDEAANEIERLRGEVDMLRDEVNWRKFADD